jgi:hypothetical protein
MKTYKLTYNGVTSLVPQFALAEALQLRGTL